MKQLTRLLSLLLASAGLLFVISNDSLAQQTSLTISKTSIAFGNITVFTPKTDSFYIKNTTQFGFGLTGFSKKSSRYTIDGNPNALLTGFDSVKVRVIFNPDSVGALLDTLVITHTSSSQAAFKVALSGTGVNNIIIISAVSAAPLTALNFVQGLATVEVPDSLTIKNNAKDSVTISGVSFDNAKFRTTITTPFKLASGATQKVYVFYKGTAVGRDAGNLVVTHNDVAKASSPVLLPVSGRSLGNMAFSLGGVILDTNVVRVSATATASPGKTDPVMAIDSTKLVQVTLRNLGTGNIRVDSIKFNGPHFTNIYPTPYEQRNGASYDRILNFNFKALSASSPTFKDTVTVFTNDTVPGGNRIRLPFEAAAAPRAYVRNATTGTSFDFGTVPLGAPSNGTMRIFNYTGATMTVDSMRFFVGDAKYQITTTATNLTLNRADTALVNIRFTPNDTLPDLGSTHPDTVLVYSSAFSSSPVKFPVKAKVAPSIVFSPSITTLNFGDLAVSQTKDSTFKVFNRTNTAYKIDSLSLNKGQHYIIMSNSLATPLASQDSTAIQIRFKPLSAGVLIDTLYIWHNFTPLGITNPRKIILTGNGSTQQFINPSNYITVDNIQGPNGATVSAPDSSYIETSVAPYGTFYDNAGGATSYGAGHRRSPNLDGSPNGASARYTFKVDSTAPYLIYHYVQNSPNVGDGYYVHLRKFGVGGIVDSLRYNEQLNNATGFGGTWLPLMFHRIDGVGPGAASITIGSDALSSTFMRVDAVRFLRSTQKADLEFGRRTREFDPTRVPEEFGQITLGDEFVKPFRLYNLGKDTLVITDVKFYPKLTPIPWASVKNFTLGTSIKIPPLTVGTNGQETGGSFDLQLAFSPFQEGSARDSMVITSNDGNEPNAYIIILGDGVNYNFIMNASVGGTEPHFRAPAPPAVPTFPTYSETPNGSWLSSARAAAPFPINGGNSFSRVNTGGATTLPHQAFYKFELPEIVLGKIKTDGRYILEYGGPAGSPNGYPNTLVKVTHTFGVPPDSGYYSATTPGSHLWLQIGGTAKTFFLTPGGPITIEFARNAQTEVGVGANVFLRTDLLRIRKVPTGALIGVDVVQGTAVQFGDVNFRSPAGLDGKANKKDVLIASRGESQIVVSSIKFRSGKYFRVANMPALPTYLRALTGEQKLTMEFTPDKIALTFRDTLEVKSNSTRDSVLLVAVGGNGIGGTFIVDDDGSVQEVSSNPAWGGLYAS
ncbi:MAG: choice-of-anchor D domain-containing protein [Ignavibacteriales bacterium]|nr:choice-of-anchor D domain-containing protein [Ignavibacteriales bacterium]